MDLSVACAAVVARLVFRAVSSCLRTGTLLVYIGLVMTGFLGVKKGAGLGRARAGVEALSQCARAHSTRRRLPHRMLPLAHQAKCLIARHRRRNRRSTRHCADSSSRLRYSPHDNPARYAAPSAVSRSPAAAPPECPAGRPGIASAGHWRTAPPSTRNSPTGAPPAATASRLPWPSIHRGALDTRCSPAPRAQGVQPPSLPRVTPNERAACVGVPVRRAKAGECGHEISRRRCAGHAARRDVSISFAVLPWIARRPSRSHCTTAPPMNTLPSSANSGVAPICARWEVMRPLVELWNVPPVCISMKQPVP